MRRTFLPASLALLASSCCLQTGKASAETFLINASGYNPNTLQTTTFNLAVTGTQESSNPGAYDLTSGGGVVTISSAGTTATESLTLYLPSGSSTQSYFVEFPNSDQFTYDNVLFPGGTTLNGAQGADLDEFGLLFTSPVDEFNLFGQHGYAFTDHEVLIGFNSPLDTFAVTQQSAVTPEPSSFLLLGTGLLGAAGMVRRRFQA